MKVYIRNWRLLLFSLICVFLICLGLVLTLKANDAPKSAPYLELTGPDDEEYLRCSVPAPLPLDTTVWWYGDGVIIDSELLLSGLQDSYISVTDLFDLLDHVPDEVQCSISDVKVGYDAVMSNIVYLVEEDED